MGITYQTSNRQRRKVMTAPLTPLPEAEAPASPVAAERTPAPARAPRRLWPMALAAGIGAIALHAVHLF